MSGLTEQIDALTGAQPQELRGQLRALARQGADLLAAADYARQLAIVDIEWSLRLSGALMAVTEERSASRVRAMTAHAHAHCYAGSIDECRAALSDALRLANEVGDPIEQAGVQLAFVQPLFLAGLLKEAAEMARAARDQYAALGHCESAAMADSNLGGVLRRQGLPKEAIKHFDRAREVLCNNPVKRAVIDSNRAEVLLDLDDYAGALRAFDTSLVAFDSGGNRHAAALVEGNIADLRSRQGMPDLALRHFELTRRRLEAIGAGVDAEVARLLAEEADCLAQVGASQDASRCYGEAIAKLDAIGLAQEAARARLGEAVVLTNLGDLPAATSARLDAYERFSRAESASGLADVRIVQGDVLMRKGEVAQAIGLYRDALARVRDRPSKAAFVRCGLAFAHLQAGQVAEAAAAIAEAEAEPVCELLPPLRARVHHIHGKLDLLRGRRAEAAERFRAAVAVQDRMRASLTADRLRSALVTGGYDLYHDLWSAALELPESVGAPLAFDALERFRARSLLDLIHSEAAAATDDSGPSGSADSWLRAELADCQAALNVTYNRMGLGAEPGESPDQMGRLAARLAELEARFEEIERRLTATREPSSVFGQPLPLCEAQRALGADSAIVYYFSEADRVGAIVIRSGKVSVFRSLAGEREIAALARRLTFLVESSIVRASAGLKLPATSRAWEASSGELYRLILAPMRAALDGIARVGLVPCAHLHGVPWHALYNGHGYVLKDFETIYMPSATIGLRLGQSVAASDPSRSLLAAGVSDEFAPHAAAEAREIAALSPAGRALVDEQATVEAFARAARHAHTIHLATHSVFSDASPLSSRAKLFDRWISAREIAGLRYSGATIILAGCETGRSSSDTGEERYGLIRAFLAGGAREVLASLWPLNDELARSLFVDLHRRLLGRAADASAARTLRETQLDHADIHPAFWAGLFVVGGLAS